MLHLPEDFLLNLLTNQANRQLNGIVNRLRAGSAMTDHNNAIHAKQKGTTRFRIIQFATQSPQ